VMTHCRSTKPLERLFVCWKTLNRVHGSCAGAWDNDADVPPFSFGTLIPSHGSFGFLSSLQYTLDAKVFFCRDILRSWAVLACNAS